MVVSACFNSGGADRVALGDDQCQSVQQQVAARAGEPDHPSPRRPPPADLDDGRAPWPAGRRTGPPRTHPGRSPGRAGCRVAPSRLAALSSSGGASLPRLVAYAICPCSRSARAAELVERPGLGHREQVQRGVRVSGQVLGLRGRQRAVGPQRRVDGESDRCLQEGGRRGQSAAGLCPTGRSLQFAGHRFIGFDGRLRQVPGAAVGVEIGVGDLGQRAVHSRPPRPTPTGTTADRTSGWRNRTCPPSSIRTVRHRGAAASARSRAAPSPATAGHVTDRLDRGRQQQLPAGAGSAASRRMKPCSIRLAVGGRSARRTRTPAPPPSARGEVPATPAGFPGSRRRSGPGPRAIKAVITSRAAARASAPLSPSMSRSGNRPNADALGSRTANTTPTCSAKSRRATKARVCAETGQATARRRRGRSGVAGPTSDIRLSTASPPGNDPATDRSSGRTRCRGRRVAAGQVLEVIQHRRTELMQPGIGKLHLGFDSGRPRTRQPVARPGRYSSSADFPTPGSPRRTST